MPAVERECLPIAQAADLHESKALREAAILAGKSDILETCDIKLAFAEKAMTDADIVSVFSVKTAHGFEFIKDGELIEKRLKFYKDYPTGEEVGQLREKYGSDVIGFYEEYFSGIGLLHREYDVPYLSQELFMFTDSLKRNGNDQTPFSPAYILKSIGSEVNSQYTEPVKWACGSAEFPPYFLLSVIGMFAMAAVESEDGGLMETFFRVSGDCLERSPSKEHAQSVGRALVVAGRLYFRDSGGNESFQYKRRKYEVGSHLEIPGLAEIVRGKKAMLFGWSSYCFACKTAMPKINEYIERNKNAVVVGLIPDDGSDEAIEAIRLKHNALWQDLRVGAELMDSISTSLPFFVFLDEEGKIERIERGSNLQLD